MNWYLTGSKSEGLDLAGSDIDFMIDWNDMCRIEVSESMQELLQSFRENKFLLIPDDAYPGFAWLKCINPVNDLSLFKSLRCISNAMWLSSTKFVSLLIKQHGEDTIVKLQGPSMETYSKYSKMNDDGTDVVASIRCQSWHTALSNNLI